MFQPIAYWKEPRVWRSVKIGSVLLLALIVPTALVFEFWVWHTLSSVFLVVGVCACTLLAALLYMLFVKERRGREVCFTYLLLFVTVVCVFVATVTIQHRPADVSLAGSMQPLSGSASASGQAASLQPKPCGRLFREGTPCVLTDGKPGHREMVDRFLIWEAVGILQTLAFASLIYLELWVTKNFEPLSITLLLGSGAVTLFGTWDSFVAHDFHSQLCATVGFTFLIFLIDLRLWQGARKANRTGGQSLEAIEDRHLSNVVWNVDLLMFLAIVTVAIVAAGWHVGASSDDLRFDELLAQRFFSGGTAFSLMFGNMSLFVLRVCKHRETYTGCRATSFSDFLGL